MADHDVSTFETELCEHLVVGPMLQNPTVRTRMRNNTPQQVAARNARKEGSTDALVDAQAAYGDLVKRLFDGETTRADYFHSLITLLYAEAARPTAARDAR